MYREIYDLLNQHGKITTAIYLDGPDAGQKYIEGQEVKEGSSCRFLEEMARTCKKTEIVKDKYGARIFVEKYQKNPHLIILGGGHVACPVAHIGKMLGFHVTVMDDRAEFVTKERFPDADVRIHDSFLNFSERILPYENAYYVVITRGHKGDALCRTDSETALHILWNDRKQDKGEAHERTAAKRGFYGQSAGHDLCTHRTSYRRGDAGRNRRQHHGADRAGKKSGRVRDLG